MNQATSPDVDGRRADGRSRPTRPILVTAEEEREFRLAIEAYKGRSGRNFPTWSEILEVLRSIGYAKRIWRPVGIWSPVSTGALGGPGGPEEPSGIFGWSSQVETPVGY